MKKVLTSLVPFKKIRPSKKAMLLTGYLLVVALLIAAVTWRGLSVEPVEIAPLEPGAVEAGTEEQPAVKPEPPFNALDEEDVVEGVLPQEDALPVLAQPQEPMQWPLEGQILFGHHEVYRIGNQLRANVGVDIEAEAGSEVWAAWPGIVEQVTLDARYGWLLEIRHGGGYLTQYANLHEEPYVSVGDEVKGGDLVGIVGESAKLAASQGAFLHFAVFKDGQALDPVEVLSSR